MLVPLSTQLFPEYTKIKAKMPTQIFNDLFNKIKVNENAHNIISLLHVMLHMHAEKLEGGEHPPLCVQTEELQQQKAIVKKLSEKVDHQKIALKELQQRNEDMNAELAKLRDNNLMIRQVNKQLYGRSKKQEEVCEGMCHQITAAKEEMKEQRALIAELQQRSAARKKDVKEKGVSRGEGWEAEELPPPPRKKRPKAKVGAHEAIGDDGVRKPGSVRASRVRSHKAVTEKRAGTPQRARGLKDTTPTKVPGDTPPRPTMKDTLPGQSSSSGRTPVKDEVQAPGGVTTRKSTSVLQDDAKARPPKAPPLGPKAQLQPQEPLKRARPSQQMSAGASQGCEDKSSLFPVRDAEFQRDEEFSSWGHNGHVPSLNSDDNKLLC